MSGFTISQITKNGIESIKEMLAPEVVSAIKNDLPATALAVVEDDTAVGALGGAADGDTFEIVSLYVDPESRRRGAGTALMKELFLLAEAEELMVRAEYTPTDEEGETLKPFFLALGFRQEEVVFPVYCIDSIKNFTLDTRSLPGTMSDILSFRETPDKLLKASGLLNGEEGESLIADMAKRELSFCAVQNDEIHACLVTEEAGDGIMEITPLWEEDGDLRDVKLMLSYALDEIRKTCSGDIRIAIPVFEPETRQIVEEFFGSSTAATVSFVKSSFAGL